MRLVPPVRIRPISSPPGPRNSVIHSLLWLIKKPTGSPGGRGDRDRAGVRRLLAGQLEPGMAFGFGSGRQQLPVSVEDLVVRAVGQQLPRLPDPQRPEVKGVFHTAEYARQVNPGNANYRWGSH